MVVSIDGGRFFEVLNDVKVVLGDGNELHITITPDGVVYDRVSGGEVIDSTSVFVNDILPEDGPDGAFTD